MDDELRLRFVPQLDDDGAAVGVNIYMNSAGQLALLRELAALGPSNRHAHLDALLTPMGTRDLVAINVVFTEGRGDIARAPPT
jgi:hypothetical protein